MMAVYEQEWPEFRARVTEVFTTVFPTTRGAARMRCPKCQSLEHA